MVAQLSACWCVWINVLAVAKNDEDQESSAPLPTTETDDADLMLRFQKGDRACFEALFQKYKRPVLNFVYRLTGRQDLAEELAQDIFVKCYQAAPNYRPEAKFSTWLFRIARNHCLNEMRRPAFRKPPEPLDVERLQLSAETSPEAQAAARDLGRVVETALAALPERQRTALLLCRVQHMAYDEIAQSMQTSVSAIKSLLNRATRQLVADLKQHGGLAHEV